MPLAKQLGLTLWRLFTDGDPTAKWTRDRDMRIVLDLDAGTFCGVPLGEPVERLRRLGQCSDVDFTKNEPCPDCDCGLREHGPKFWTHLDYASDGFFIGCSPSLILDLICVTLQPVLGVATPYRHTIVRNAQEIWPATILDANAIQGIFGPPDEIVDAFDLEDEENPLPEETRSIIAVRPMRYHYKRNAFELAISFDKQDNAYSFLMYTPLNPRGSCN